MSWQIYYATSASQHFLMSFVALADMQALTHLSRYSWPHLERKLYLNLWSIPSNLQFWCHPFELNAAYREYNWTLQTCQGETPPDAAPRHTHINHTWSPRASWWKNILRKAAFQLRKRGDATCQRRAQTSLFFCWPCLTPRHKDSSGPSAQTIVFM